jgi:hypothetical protein|tara:strand:- start:44 stop:889 length:846 start_codon:yes stop_codon:yes gene_type:complete
MITVHYSGRLGNNLFQYSLGRTLAEKMGYQLQASSIEGFSGTETTVEGKTVTENPIQFYNQFLEMDGKHISIDDVTKIKDRHIVLGGNGFFQRYEYYKPYKERIRKWFDIENLDVGQTEEDVVIHLRMGDCITGFVPHRDPYIMPFEYYETILLSSPFKNLYICSDPETLDHPIFLEYMKKFEKYSPVLLKGNTIEDFRAVKSFNKIIMSQSTFSWWAAFLSNASEIFVPVPAAERHPLGDEWSLASPGVALFVDDESRYKYVKQHESEWFLENIEEIEET